MNRNIDADKKNTYDAIVVGTGISGGWAAKELTEKGLKTLVLERGRMVKHSDYPTATKNPWDVENGGRRPTEDLKKQGVQTRTGYTIRQETKHLFVNDLENPYTEVNRFDWMRGYHVGGRSLMWGRQSYRFSQLDFEANAKDGIAIDWPVRYNELAPWYDKVEQFIGVSGQVENIPNLPDCKLLLPMELNIVEQILKTKYIKILLTYKSNLKYQYFKKDEKYKLGRMNTIERTANATAALPHSTQRGTCHYQNLCSRGCPYGAYFSSNSSTLPAAEKTGNMTLRPNSIVYELIYDEKKGRASGVRVLDAETGEQMEFHAKVIFLCASTFGSTHILMNSVSSRFPDGFGNDRGELGCSIMDHHLGAGAHAVVDSFEVG